MITYPVNVQESLWDLVDTTTGMVLAQGVRWPRKDGGRIVGLGTGLAYIEHTNTQPAYSFTKTSFQHHKKQQSRKKTCEIDAATAFVACF